MKNNLVLGWYRVALKCRHETKIRVAVKNNILFPLAQLGIVPNFIHMKADTKLRNANFSLMPRYGLDDE